MILDKHVKINTISKYIPKLKKYSMQVSIVIPVYNGEEYLSKCVESALNQTYSDIEVIAVNDGSTDGSLGILEKYKDRIRIINKKNGGTSSALNTGISIMKGEWFKWLSADDILNKNAIQILMSEVVKLKDDAKSYIFYSNFDYIDKNGKVIGEYIEPNYNNLKLFDKQITLLDHFYGNGSTSIIHKSIFNKCGLFDEGIKYQDDYEFWLRCCVLFDIPLYLIPQKLVKYRIHKNQLTEKISLEKQKKQNDQTRNLILKKIDAPKRKQYEIALKRYQRKIIFRSPKKIIKYLILKFLPNSISSKIMEKYKKLFGQKFY